MPSLDPTLARLLDNNAKWASAVSAAEPGFFEATTKGQAPKVCTAIFVVWLLREAGGQVDGKDG